MKKWKSYIAAILNLLPVVSLVTDVMSSVAEALVFEEPAVDMFIVSRLGVKMDPDPFIPTDHSAGVATSE